MQILGHKFGNDGVSIYLFSNELVHADDRAPGNAGILDLIRRSAEKVPTFRPDTTVRS